MSKITQIAFSTSYCQLMSLLVTIAKRRKHGEKKKQKSRKMKNVYFLFFYGIISGACNKLIVNLTKVLPAVNDFGAKSRCIAGHELTLRQRQRLIDLDDHLLIVLFKWTFTIRSSPVITNNSSTVR